jgi:hypothetical protein
MGFGVSPPNGISGCAANDEDEKQTLVPAFTFMQRSASAAMDPTNSEHGRRSGPFDPRRRGSRSAPSGDVRGCVQVGVVSAWRKSAAVSGALSAALSTAMSAATSAGASVPVSGA